MSEPASLSAFELKNRGDVAWKEGSIEVAISAWNEAINVADITNKDLLKKLYSNRSAAYVKTEQFTAALLDAEKCCELDSEWTKSHLRKGDALIKLRRFVEAYNSYNTGLRCNPNDNELKGRVDFALREIGREEERRHENYSTPEGTLLGKIESYARIGLFVNALLYCLPVGRSFNNNSFILFVLSTVIANGLAIYHKHGKIQWSAAYASRVFPDSSATQLFLCILLVSSSPYMCAMLPVVLAELAMSTPTILKYGNQNSQLIKDQLGPLLVKFASKLVKNSENKNIDNLIANIFSEKTMSQVTIQLKRSAVICEIFQGIYLLIEIAFPTRNLLLLVMWWQFLQMRFLIDKSGDVKAAFDSFDKTITSILTHRFVPSVIFSLYQMIREFLSKQAQSPATEKGKGKTDKDKSSTCAVM